MVNGIVILGILNQSLYLHQQHPNKIDSKSKSEKFMNININIMINEFLNMTYRWCGSDSTII